jgi:triacylglycerol lipase
MRKPPASPRIPIPAALALALALCSSLASPAFAADPADAPAGLPGPLASRLPEPPPRANFHGFVLVHGFLGFGGKGPAGLNYWGGRLDLIEELRARGYQAVAVQVGPISSNWDRACELFAQLRGGRVDYGQAHARAAGHQRFGRSCPGLLPEWGEDHPVHLVGHSMGGVTSRLLVQLLEEGDPAERAATPPEELNPLFAGGHTGERAWVRSVTTLASPHDGTTLVYRFELASRGLRRFGAGVYYRGVRAARRNRAARGLGLDLQLEAWGLEPAPGEPMCRFRRRFVEAEDWWRSRDAGMWDCSPQGARELNLRVAARPGVYYFSWATEQTTRDPFSGRQVPEPGMGFLTYSLAAYMGGRGRDPAWWPNDGIVSTCSMDGPTSGSEDRIAVYAGEPKPGVWNFMGVLSSCDHLDVIGLPSACVRPAGYAGLPEFYVAIAALLAGLPE